MVAKFRKHNYRTAVTIWLAPTLMYQINCILDRGAESGLLRESMLNTEWLKAFKTESTPQLGGMKNHSLFVVRTKILDVRIEEAQVCIVLRVARQLAAPVLLETSFIDRFVCTISHEQRKVVPHSFVSVPKLYGGDIIWRCREKRTKRE